MTTSAGSGPIPKLSDNDDIQSPDDGAGPMNHRSYRLRICGSLLSPAELIEMFRRDPNRFSPTSYATFSPEPGPDGMHVGDRLEVKLPGPWDGPIRVASVGEQTIRFETLVGHMEAGSIEFSTMRVSDAVEFQIESIARSGDPVFDVLYHQVGIGRLFQTEMWVQVLESAVTVSGGHQQGRPEVMTIIYEGADA